MSAFIEGREHPVGESGNVHRLESERQSVQILTMHKSKGLEAEVVFLAGGLSEPPDDQLSPHVFHDGEGHRLAWVGPPTEEVRARLRRERREEAERLLYVAMTRARSALYLPYFGAPPPGAADGDVSYDLVVTPSPAAETRSQLSLFFEDPETAEPEPEDAEAEYELKRMSGPYRVLNERLAALVAAGETESGAGMFARVEVPVVPRRDRRVDPRATLASFRAPTELGAHVAIDSARFAALRRAHAGFDVTSYTRMKRGHGGYQAPEPEQEPAEAFVTEAMDAALPSVATDELPGGTSIGVFLHELLEHLPFERALEIEDGAALLADDALRSLFDRRAQANGVELRWAPLAAELVVRALKAPLTLADGSRLSEGLAAVTRRAAELPFLHPIPERSHPSLAEPPPGPDRAALSIERGYIRGVIDLVIEHEGRYHVIDYKSDRLPSYAPDAVSAHVARNYLVQARLYTLGTLRALAIHDRDAYETRFGGLLYAFLRGMGEAGEGVWTFRPSWDDVLEWERALHHDAPWGYPLPPRRRAQLGS